MKIHRASRSVMAALIGFVLLLSAGFSSGSGSGSGQLDLCYREEVDDVDGNSERYSYKCDQLGFTGMPDVNTPFKNRTIKFSLKRNHITAIENDAFIGMVMLEEIDLDDNVIVSIQPDAFLSVRLRILSASNNQLDSVPTRAFSRTSDLSDLDLSRNRIQMIRNTDFQNLINLRRLQLSENNITRVEPFAFKDLRRLVFLGLAKNRIHMFEAVMEHALPSLKSFQVHDNPWHCDCQQRWVFLRAVKDGVLAPRCTSPDRMRGLLWSQLNERDFACAPEIWRAVGDENGTLEVIQDFTVTLTCGVFSDPIGSSSWYRNGQRLFENDPRIIVSTGRPLDGTVRANQTYYSELKIPKAVVNDSGLYTCEVFNSAGGASANITLLISEPVVKNDGGGGAGSGSSATMQKSDVTRSREVTALHYALVACASIACAVTLISIIACGFYCTKRMLLLRYARRCRAYQPAKNEAEAAKNARNTPIIADANGNNTLNMNPNSLGQNLGLNYGGYAANLILNSTGEDHMGTYRSCNFVDNYNCIDSHLNMLSEPDNRRCEYASVMKSNDCAAYYPDIHQCNIPQKETLVLLQQDGSACHHILAATASSENSSQTCGCQRFWQQNVASQFAPNQPGIETCPDTNSDSHAHSNLSSPTANAPCITSPINQDNQSVTANCITFKPSVTPANSNSSFSTMTVIRNARRNNASATYAPVANHEDDKERLARNDRTGSTSTFTSATPRLVGNDQISLV